MLFVSRQRQTSDDQLVGQGCKESGETQRRFPTRSDLWSGGGALLDGLGPDGFLAKCRGIIDAQLLAAS